MSNNQKYIVLPGGKECKKVNPFKMTTKWGISQQWKDFETNNPVLALTEVMPEGETFSGVEVWQYNADGKISICKEETKLKYKDLNQLSETVKKLNGGSAWVAIKPLKAIEPAQKDAGSYLMLSNVPTKEQDGINPALLALWSNIEIWFGDIGKSESGRKFLLRMQDLYNVQLKGEDTGNLVNSFTFLKKLHPATPLAGMVDNKETVEEAAYNMWQRGSYKNDERAEIIYTIGAKFGANWHQSQSIEARELQTTCDELADEVLKWQSMYNQLSKSKQSIEGIVGFVLEWVANNVNMIYHDGHNKKDYPTSHHQSGADNIQPNRNGILNMKSDIIKEYNITSKP